MDESQIIFYSVFLGLIFLSIAIYALCQHLDKKKKVERVELYSFIKTGLAQTVDIKVFFSTIETMAHKQRWSCYQVSRAIAEVTCTSMLNKPIGSALFSWIDIPRFAVWYAVNVFASENTRKMACINPLTAIDYALYVDKMPHHTTRSAACRLGVVPNYLEAPYNTFFAIDRSFGYTNVEKQHNYSLPWKVLVSSGRFAIDYALKVDKSPNEETREAACRHFVTAMEYAIQIDRGPNEKTRKACCEDARCAFEYAFNIDKSAHPDTYRSVCGLQLHHGLVRWKHVKFNDLVRQYEASLGKPKI
jgi:hypothetical protein